MKFQPPRSACFKPEDYTSVDLFADREADREDLLQMLESFLAPDGPGAAHVLVWGPRGIGKSILSRWVIQQLADKLGVPVAEADCAGGASAPDSVLREIARSMADRVTD